MEYRTERRLDPRVRVKVRLVVIDERSGLAHVLHTTNLSAGGARCTGVSGLPVGGDLEGALYLPLSEGGRDIDVPIPVHVTVLRSPADEKWTASGGEIAVAFDMSEIDRDELRRFLLDWMAADSGRQDLLAAREA